MITVRFPNGQTIRYNQASYAVRSTHGYTDLSTKKDGDWIAQVPNSCLIEAVAACAVYNPLTDTTNHKLDELAREIRLLKRKIVRK